MQKGSPREAGQTQVLILVGIVLVLAVAGGIFYLGRITLLRQDSSGQAAPKPQPQNVATPSPQPSPAPDETVYTESDRSANWKTYTNTTFGYSIKFPSSYEVPLQSVRQKNQLGIDNNMCVTNKTTTTCHVVINIYENSANLSLERWLDTHIIPISGYSGPVKETLKTSLNGNAALKARNETQVVYYLTHNTNIYEIQSSINQEDLQILSTFKFLD